MIQKPQCKIQYMKIFKVYEHIISKMVHKKCRNTVYPFSKVSRVTVADDQVPWSFAWDSYDPPEYNSNVLINKPWADPPLDCPDFKPDWNKLDGLINRKSHKGSYTIVDGRPSNPEGRTGIKGRGVLGKWGPNHAADPIVTRWKLVDSEKLVDPTTSLPVLQFCAIQRRDCQQWALPGGMVDPGERVTETLQREFLEEALNSLEASEEQREEDAKIIQVFFSRGVTVYEGYVDDPRNTDNAWMETVAVNFHDETGEVVGKFDLEAGDDAQHVQWVDIHKDLELYASHSDFVKAVVQRLQAHW